MVPLVRPVTEVLVAGGVPVTTVGVCAVVPTYGSRYRGDRATVARRRGPGDRAARGISCGRRDARGCVRRSGRGLAAGLKDHGSHLPDRLGAGAHGGGWRSPCSDDLVLGQHFHMTVSEMLVRAV